MTPARAVDRHRQMCGMTVSLSVNHVNEWCHVVSDVNKDWTYKDKDKDQAYKDQDKDWTCKDKDKDKDLTHKDQDKDKDLNLVLKDKDKDFTYSYLLQVAAKPTISIKQQQWTQCESSQHMTVKP